MVLGDLPDHNQALNSKRLHTKAHTATPRASDAHFLVWICTQVTLPYFPLTLSPDSAAATIFYQYVSLWCIFSAD